MIDAPYSLAEDFACLLMSDTPGSLVALSNQKLWLLLVALTTTGAVIQEDRGEPKYPS